MNTYPTTGSGRVDHPPQPTEARPRQVADLHQADDQQRATFRQQARRVGALDRAALHLGVALIKWGRRPKAAPTRDERRLRAEQQFAAVAREREAERELRLTVPPR